MLIAVYTSLPEQRPQILYELLLVVREPTSNLFLMKFGTHSAGDPEGKALSPCPRAGF